MQRSWPQCSYWATDGRTDGYFRVHHHIEIEPGHYPALHGRYILCDRHSHLPQSRLGVRYSPSGIWNRTAPVLCHSFSQFSRWNIFHEQRVVSITPLRWVHNCNVTAYRNAVTLQVTDTIRSYELNFHPVPHGVTVSCERYTLGVPVCYGSPSDVFAANSAFVHLRIQCVPLTTEPGVSLIILTSMKILQQNMNRSAFVVWEMKRNVSVVCVCLRFKFRCNILVSGKIIKEMPGSVASGSQGITL